MSGLRTNSNNPTLKGGELVFRTPKNCKIAPKGVPKEGPTWTQSRFKAALGRFFEPRGLKKEAPGVSSKIGPIWGSFWDPQKWRKHYK